MGLSMPRSWPTFWPPRRRRIRGLRGQNTQTPSTGLVRTGLYWAPAGLSGKAHGRPAAQTGAPSSVLQSPVVDGSVRGATVRARAEQALQRADHDLAQLDITRGQMKVSALSLL